MNSVALVDLFCGAGGLSLGLKQAGMQPVFAADFDTYSCETYRNNLGSHVQRLNLKEITPNELTSRIMAECERVDVVAGGPPCQGFSVQRRGQASDERNELVTKFGQFAAALRPKAIIMENVPTILGKRGQHFVQTVCEAWVDDYDIYTAVLDAASFGVAQFRRRAFIVAIRKALNCSFSFPAAKHTSDNYVTVKEALRGLPPPPKGFEEHPHFFNHRRVAISALNLERIRHVPEGGGRLDLPEELQLPCHKSSNGHRHLDVYGRLAWDKPAGTLTAMFDNFTRGRFAHPTEDRNITSREGARIQSFPDAFRFIGPKKDVARQIGNAVPPLLAQAVGEAIMKTLGKSREAMENESKSILAGV